MNFDEKELRQRLEYLVALTKHPGYAYMAEMIKLEAQKSYDMMRKVNNSHDLAKHLGAHASLMDVQDWPRREADAIRNVLSRLELDKLNNVGQ